MYRNRQSPDIAMVIHRTLRSSYFSSFLQHHQSTVPSLRNPPSTSPITVLNLDSRFSSRSSSPFLVSERRISAKTEHVDSEVGTGVSESAGVEKAVKQESRSPFDSLYSLFVNPSGSSGSKSRRTVGAKTSTLSSSFVKPPASLTGKTPSLPKGKKKRSSSPVESIRTGDKDMLEVASPEMVLLANRLYEEGYLKDANFLKEEPFEINRDCNNYYSRSYLKMAADNFGHDHQEIAKWLSGSALKTVALFGCPSLEKRPVYAAKRLRSFFHIQEDIVCRGCKMKGSCKFVNKGVDKEDKLFLTDVLRVLTVYASGSDPRCLPISEDMKSSVTKSLKEIINLSSSKAQA